MASRTPSSPSVRTTLVPSSSERRRELTNKFTLSDNAARRPAHPSRAWTGSLAALVPAHGPQRRAAQQPLAVRSLATARLLIGVDPVFPKYALSCFDRSYFLLSAIVSRTKTPSVFAVKQPQPTLSTTESICHCFAIRQSALCLSEEGTRSTGSATLSSLAHRLHELVDFSVDGEELAYAPAPTQTKM